MSLETDLKNALRRVPAPEGFAERVRHVILSRPSASLRAGSDGEELVLSERSESKESRSRRFFAALRMTESWRAILATFLLAVVLGGWGAHEMIERRREGQRARQQVLLALRIAGSKVARAQHEVSRQIQR